MKKHKGTLAGIFILTLFVAAALGAVLSVWSNSGAYIESELQRAGYGELTAWVSGIYDIPSRYEIPSNPKTITSEKAGEVYYSEPNRIILFYGDAEVSSEYTKVGYFDFTKELKQAVENNPVLEDWGNKIVHISRAD